MPVTVPVQQNSAYPQQQTQQNSNVGQTLMPPQTHPPGSLSPGRPSSTGKPLRTWVNSCKKACTSHLMKCAMDKTDQRWTYFRWNDGSLDFGKRIPTGKFPRIPTGKFTRIPAGKFTRISAGQFTITPGPRRLSLPRHAGYVSRITGMTYY